MEQGEEDALGIRGADRPPVQVQVVVPFPSLRMEHFPVRGPKEFDLYPHLAQIRPDGLRRLRPRFQGGIIQQTQRQSRLCARRVEERARSPRIAYRLVKLWIVA